MVWLQLAQAGDIVGGLAVARGKDLALGLDAHGVALFQINQFQKRVETFFSEWANHALRSYIASMSGKHWITVDAKTRKRIESIEDAMAQQAELEIKQELASIPGMPAPELNIEPETIIDGNKVEVDFDKLNEDMLFEFTVRTGSLIENERETERANIQEMLIPVSQMIGNISDQNRDAFERVIMQLVVRLCELSDIDISASAAATINDKLVMGALQSTMDAVMAQQGQINQMQQAMGMAPQQPMSPEMQGMPPEAMMPPEAGMPAGVPEMPPEAMVAPEEGIPPEAAGMPADMMPQAGMEGMPPEEIM